MMRLGASGGATRMRLRSGSTAAAREDGGGGGCSSLTLIGGAIGGLAATLAKHMSAISPAQMRLHITCCALQTDHGCSCWCSSARSSRRLRRQQKTANLLAVRPKV